MDEDDSQAAVVIRLKHFRKTESVNISHNF
jgi:hypothetical protein